MYGQISYWAFKDGMTGKRSVVEAMRLARKVGFDGIELCISAEGELTPNTPKRQCRLLAAEAKAIGIKLGSAASGLLWGVNPASARKSTRLKALSITKKCLRVTGDLGVRHLLVLPGHVDVFFMPSAEVVPYDDCYKRAIFFCRSLAGTCEKTGVTACIENVWNRFLLSPLEFKRFIKEVGSRRIGAYFDVGNVWLFGYPQHWINILGRLIKRVHVKDFKRSVGTAEGFAQLLDGDVPLAESLKLLGKLGYKGPVTAEVFPGPDDRDEMAFLRKTARRLNKIIP